LGKIQDNALAFSRRRFELVVPLTVGGRTWGVLDLDSPEPDRAALEKIAAQIEAQAARL